MTEAEMLACAMDLEEKEAFEEHYRGIPSPDDLDEIPSQCERCGDPFGSGAVLVGARWVCNDCEQDEYEEPELYAIHLDNEFASQREDAW